MDYRSYTVISYLGLNGAIVRHDVEWTIPVCPGKDLGLVD